MNATAKLKEILAPLAIHRNQLCGQRGDPNRMSIGAFTSNDPDEPVISHSDFVIEVVLPALDGACKRFGRANVARQIVQLVSPLYHKPIESGRMRKGLNLFDEAAAFLSCTLTGGHESGNISADVTNTILAEKYGVKRVFSPIVDLGLVHMETDVFDACKFFHHHACRMGEIIEIFGDKSFREYIEICKLLLRNDVYDWSIENDPEEWGMLVPSVRLYGMSAVLSPMANAMISTSHLPGTKNDKYKYSLMHRTIKALYPILLPKVRKNGPEEIEKMLQPIVEFVLNLSEEGAFLEDRAHHRSVEGQFFEALATDYIGGIEEKGIQQVLKEMFPIWKKKLITRVSG